MIRKLTSRKFWALVTVLVTSILVLFDTDVETITQVTALITATGTTVAYLFVQGKLDDKDWFDENQSH
jgi:hypothetical protein